MTNDNKVLFSESIDAGSRKYKFEVKTSINEANYLIITEAQRGKINGRIFIFEEHFGLVFTRLLKIIEFMTMRKKKFSIVEIRKKFPRAYEKWTAEDEKKLSLLYTAGVNKFDIGKILKRQPGAISSRLHKLGLQ